MLWLRRLANGLLKRFGIVVVQLDVLDDLVAMTICQRIALQAYLEPGQVVVWDGEAKTINIVMRH